MTATKPCPRCGATTTIGFVEQMDGTRFGYWSCDSCRFSTKGNALEASA